MNLEIILSEKEEKGKLKAEICIGGVKSEEANSIEFTKSYLIKLARNFYKELEKEGFAVSFSKGGEIDPVIYERIKKRISGEIFLI